MKKYILLSFTLLILLLSANSASAASIDLDVNISGDKLSPGSSIEMSWTSSGIDSYKELDLYLESKDNGILYPVQRELVLNGSYTWVIPNFIPTADDYRLSLSTADKGPSASSNYSKEFAIYNGGNGYMITDLFAARFLSYGRSNEGRVLVEYRVGNYLPSGYEMKMNINCPDGLYVYSESPSISCKTWVSVPGRDNKINIEYKNNSNKDLYITFTLDLYKDGTLMQRKFSDSIVIDYFEEEYRKLELSVTPDEVDDGDEMIVRFNDIGAEYYMVGASCKSGVSIFIEGKDKDLCYGREKIYGGGKDVIRLDLYASSGRDTSIDIGVDAYVDGKIVKDDSQSVEISVDENESENDWDYNEWQKWGDIRFLNPKEGQRTPEELKAGHSYTLKWENIVKAEWPDVHLYKYNSKPSSDYLRNGPTNVSIGTEILDLGTAYLGQEGLIVNLPSNLEPGYYYFKFGGKAAGDSSPAIRIVEADSYENEDNNENNDVELSDSEILSFLANYFGKSSDIYMIVSLFIQLGII